MDFPRLASQALPGWNRRVFTEADFYRLCRERNVRVVEAQTGEWGLYLVHNGQDFIILDPALRGGMRLWVAMHELAHQILDAPETAAFSFARVSKKDWRANILSVVALIPKHLVKTKTLVELREEFGYPDEMIWLRKEIWERCRL